jgi:hypothetical protein
MLYNESKQNILALVVKANKIWDPNKVEFWSVYKQGETSPSGAPVKQLVHQWMKLKYPCCGSYMQIHILACLFFWESHLYLPNHGGPGSTLSIIGKTSITMDAPK